MGYRARRADKLQEELKLALLSTGIVLGMLLHCIVYGLSKEDMNELMDLMQQQLSALLPQDQNSFVELCITKEEECTEEQFTGSEAIFSWRSGITAETQDRFWKTYHCVLLKDPNQCPVDGDWTEWSPWSKCEAGCGDSGWQVQHRVCENPRPANGGDECDGIRTKNQSCIGLCAKNSNGQAEAVEYIKHMHTAFPDLQGLCIEKHCIYEEAQEAIKDPNKVDRYWSSINCVKYGGACPVNGGWGEWGAWSECSVQCGHGEVYRKRECDQPTTKNGGVFCQGLWYQVHQCLAKDCGEDETFTEWSPFSPCSESCGRYGVKTTVRSCLSEKPCLVRRRKLNEIAKTVPCFGGECPQKGGWSKWGSWTSCSAACGTGRRTRIRKCDEPYPYGGEECLGPSIEATTCDGNYCIQLPDLDQPLSETSRHERSADSDNDDCLSSPLDSSFWVGWKLKQKENSSWTWLQKHKSSLRKPFSVPSVRKFHIQAPNLNSSGMDYKKYSAEKKVDSKDKPGPTSVYQDTEANVGLSFHGLKSTHIQEMVMFHPHKLFKRKASAIENGTLRREPEIDDDDPYIMPLNPDLEYSFTKWSQWTLCTKTCGGGIRHRQRTCKNKEVVCRGEVKPEQFCNMEPCPVAGSWSQWQGWSPCSVTCGTGVAERYRACDNPLPSFGGACTGLNSQSQPCSMPRCVIKLSGKGSWGAWSLWSDCSATCGGGIRNRQKFRMLKIQRRSEKSVCNVFPCPEKGMWAAWGGWSTCSRACGLGETYRDRTCTDPAPVYGGDPCEGPGSEVETCYGGPCLDEDDYGVLLRGKSYLLYPEKGITTGFLMVFMRIKPLQLSGTLFHHSRKCHRDLIDCGCSILLTLNSGQLRLSSRAGRKNSPISVDHPSTVVLNKWQDVIIVATTTWAEIRVNDAARIVKYFPGTAEHSINFDGTLIVGTNRFKQNGFHGEIAALRKNFKVLLLYNMKAWSGYGLPSESVGVKKIQLSSDVRHPDFKGKYYSHIFFRETKYFHATATFQLSGSNGLLLFNGGTNTSSFLSVVILHGTLQFCLSCDGKSICRKAYELKTGEWYMLNVAAKGNEGQIRLNDGDAMQIMCTVGEVYQPRGSLYVSGARSKDWSVIVKVTKNQIMFFGMIDTLSINGLPITYKMATLLDVGGAVNSLGYSVSDHVTEVYEHKKTLTSLRCGVPQKAKRNHIVKIIWLQDMTQLKTGEGTDIISAETDSQTVSEVNLHSSKHDEGIYACLLSQDGSLLVLQVFVVLRFSGGETQDEESYGEWVAFIVLLLLIFFCFCPCLIYYCTKDYQIWENVRKKFKRKDDPKEEEETLINESAEESIASEGPPEAVDRGTDSIFLGPTVDNFVQNVEPTTDRESQSDFPLGADEMIQTFSPDPLFMMDEMSQAPEPKPTIGPLTAPRGKSYAQQVTIKMPPLRQYECLSQAQTCNPLINQGGICPPSIPRYNPYPCYDPCNPCNIRYDPCNLRNGGYNPCNPCHPCSPMGAGAIRPVDLLRNPYFINGMIHQARLGHNTDPNHNTNNPVLYNPATSTIHFLGMPRMNYFNTHYSQDKMSLEPNKGQVVREKWGSCQERQVTQCDWPNEERQNVGNDTQSNNRSNTMLLEGSSTVRSACDLFSDTQVSKHRQKKDNFLNRQEDRSDNFPDSFVNEGQYIGNWQTEEDLMLAKNQLNDSRISEIAGQQGNQMVFRQEKNKEEKLSLCQSECFSSYQEESSSPRSHNKTQPCPEILSTFDFGHFDSAQHAVVTEGEASCVTDSEKLPKQSTIGPFANKQLTDSFVFDSYSDRGKPTKLVRGGHWRTKSHSQMPSTSKESQRARVHFHTEPRPARSQAECETDISPSKASKE